MNKQPNNAVIRTTGVAQALAMVLGLSAVAGVASAQVVADPAAGGPRVQGTANGAQVVNINAASSAGVSRNQFSQFNVTRPGVVLNNATSATGTQLAGAVAGNAALGGVAAKVILNEVTSGQASVLAGKIEVAGQRAQVVVANPSGISVQGAGFINASRATLTTGTPVFGADGALVGYRVTGGKVSLGGKDSSYVGGLDYRGTPGGLDTKSVDFTDIIARSVDINDFVYGRSVRVVTGANQVNVDGSGMISGISRLDGVQAGQGVELNVGALGGMYANDITLVGTSEGLGVRNAGNLRASRELTVLTDGKLTTEMGSVLQAPEMDVNALEGIANHGQVFAARKARLRTAGALDNSFGVISAGTVEVQANSLTNQYGGIYADGGSLKIAGEYNTDGGSIFGVDRAY